MKIKFVRCEICSNWFGAQRNHCPVCASGKVALGNGNNFHIDTSTGRVIASGIRYKYNFKHWALQIARELMSGQAE